MRDTEGLIGVPTSRNTLGRDRWWAGEGRTLNAVLDHIRAGGEQLEMPPSPPRRPPPPARRQWLGGNDDGVFILPIVVVRAGAI